MDIFLDALKKSVQHLQTIDKTFSQKTHPNQEEYKKIRKRIKKLNSSDPDGKIPTEQLYVGGDGRQMILSDIIEYIFFGRLYYYASTTDPKQRQIFIELLLQTINLLILIESLSTQFKLRKQVLEKLEKKLKKSFFKEVDEEAFHEALKRHNNDIGITNMKSKLKAEVKQLLVKTAGSSSGEKKLDKYYDSLLPKTGGGLWNELIVFFYLLRRTTVHIIPLLLTQRILSKNNMLKPPDYLVSHKGKMYGIEVGGGKSRQSSDFAEAMPGIIPLTTENTQVPPRCPICGQFILFCPKVIKDCCDIEENPLLRISSTVGPSKREVRCIDECDIYTPSEIKKGKCPYTQYHKPKFQDSTLEKTKLNLPIKDLKKYHYHLSCVRELGDTVVEAEIERQFKLFEKKGTQVNCLKTDYPYLSVSNFDDLEPNDIVCFGKYDMMQKKDPKNCQCCNHVERCKKMTRVEKILTNENDQEILKNLREEYSNL